MATEAIYTRVSSSITGYCCSTVIRTCSVDLFLRTVDSIYLELTYLEFDLSRTKSHFHWIWPLFSLSHTLVYVELAYLEPSLLSNYFFPLGKIILYISNEY